MALNNQTATVTLSINNEEAKRRLDELNKQAITLSESIKKAYEVKDVAGAKKLTAELRNVNKEVKDIRKNADNINTAMTSLSTATPKELNKILKQINKELNSGNVKRGSAEWNAYNQKIIEVKKQLALINAEQREAAKSTLSLGAAFSKVQGFVVGATAALTGMTMAVNKMRKYRNEKDTARANLKAITGLDDESINWMQEQAEELSQNMDKTGLRIQQDAAEILEAFKGVGAAKPELLSDKEAMRDVTVEAMRLAQAAGIALKDAVEGVTVSLNEYGATAEEAAKYVNVLAAGSRNGAAGVENINKVVTRAGVAAAKAGIPIEQLVASAEVLAGKGILGRLAGTGLKTFFLKLATGADETNPKIVGLTKALQNLKRQGLTEAEFVTRFGLEAYNAASVLTENIAALKDMEKAVTNTNTAVEQAAIVGQTYEARTAQLGNQLKEIGQKIYKDIQPIVSLFMAKSAYVLKGVQKLITVIKEYGGAIAALVVPIAAYNVAIAVTNALHSKGVTAIVQYTRALFSMNTITKAATAAKWALASASLLLTGNIKKATVAFKAFSHTLKLNPIGLLATAIAGIIVALVNWRKKEDELTIAQKKRQAVQKMFAEIDEDVAKSTAEEVGRIKLLTATIHDETLSRKTRIQAIQDLQSILPEYYAELSEEGVIVNENTKAIEKYLEMLKNKGYINATSNKMTEVVGERMMAEQAVNVQREVVERLRAARDEFNSHIEGMAKANGWSYESTVNYVRQHGGKKYLTNGGMSENAASFISNPILGKNSWKELEKAETLLKEREEALKIAIEKEDKLTDFLRSKLTQNEESSTTQPKNRPRGNGPSDDVRQKALNKIDLEAAKRRVKNEKDFINGVNNYEKYNRELIDIDKWVVEEKQKLYEKGEKEYWELEMQSLDLSKRTTEQEDGFIQRRYEIRRQKIVNDFAKRQMTTQQYEKQMTDSELDEINDRIANYERLNQYIQKLEKEIAAAEDDEQKRKLIKRLAFYKRDNDTYRKMLEEKEKIYQKIENQRLQYELKKAEQNKQKQINELEDSAYVSGEQVQKREWLLIEKNYWERRMEIFNKGSDEYIDALENFQRVRKQLLNEDLKETRENFEWYNELIGSGRKEWEEYNKSMERLDKVRSQLQAEKSDMPEADYNRAASLLGQRLLDAELQKIGENNVGFIDTYKARLEKIKKLEDKGVISHQEAEQAKLQATSDMLQELQSRYDAAWSSVNNVLSAASELSKANLDYQTAIITKEYDERIKKAGNNSRKITRLEKERDAEIRKMKTDANKKAMAIELAQAAATTASAALNAYASAVKVPMIGAVLAPIAAASALAAGAIQIAAIKKAHQAEAIGYATGGFTANGRWDEPQGVVHSNEFVANRFAVANKNIRPALNLIDRAQRNNTVGSLTADDVTAALYSRTSPDVVKAVNTSRESVGSLPPNSSADTAALEATANAVSRSADVIERLSDQLDKGITAIASISGRNGIDEQTKKYNRLINNAR